MSITETRRLAHAPDQHSTRARHAKPSIRHFKLILEHAYTLFVVRCKQDR